MITNKKIGRIADATGAAFWARLGTLNRQNKHEKMRKISSAFLIFSWHFIWKLRLLFSLRRKRCRV